MLTGCGLAAGRASRPLIPGGDSGGLRSLQDKPCLHVKRQATYPQNTSYLHENDLPTVPVNCQHLLNQQDQISKAVCLDQISKAVCLDQISKAVCLELMVDSQAQ